MIGTSAAYASCSKLRRRSCSASSGNAPAFGWLPPFPQAVRQDPLQWHQVPVWPLPMFGGTLRGPLFDGQRFNALKVRSTSSWRPPVFPGESDRGAPEKSRGGPPEARSVAPCIRFLMESLDSRSIISVHAGVVQW